MYRQDNPLRDAGTDAASWMAAVVSTGAWYVAAFICLLAKYRMIALSEYSQSARNMVHHYSPVGMEGDLTGWEKISFFRVDLLIGFLLVPLALLVAGRYLGRYRRLAVVGVVSISASVLVFAQLKAFFAVGQFLSYDMFWDAFKWGWSEAGAASHYVNTGGLAKLLLAIILIAGILWSSTRVDTGRTQRFLRAYRWRAGSSLAVFCLLLITAIP